MATRKNEMNQWPKTSDKEFSKRMFIIFMWAFFAHILLTVLSEWLFSINGKAVEVFKISVPVYTTIFAAVIVKGGVENVFKGQNLKQTTTTSTTTNNG